MKKILKDKKKLMLICAIVIVLLLVIFLVIKVTSKPKNDVNNGNKQSEKKKSKDVPKLKIIDLSSDSRTYAVMINNLNPARTYQSGIQDAYIVYEIIVEGGITRMMALFKDKEDVVKRVGPIRSSRHYYLDYAMENDAIYVHDGWSPQAKSDIRTLGINNILPYAEGIFWREDLPVAYEHTEFTSLENVKNAASKKGYRLTSDQDTLLNYSVDEVNIDKEGAVDANKVDIEYSNYMTVGYEYNDKDKVYYRKANGKEHVDYVTKKQYTTKNIIIAYAANSYIPNDNKGRQDLNNLGTGSGYFITNGKAIPITWEKKTRSSQTVYKYQDGTEITVNDGNTFIQIAPPKSATIS